jgi:DNA-binding transcriptional MerR regulator
MSERNKSAQVRRYPERQARIEQMNTLRDSGLSLSQIGERYGLTRERVRQLIEGRKKPPKPPKWPLKYFRRIMRQWLWDANIHRCGICKLWACDVTAVQRRCKECNRQRTAAYFATQHGRETQKRWQIKNPDKLRLYRKRWQAKRTARLRDLSPGRTQKAELLRDPNVEDLLNALRSIVQRRTQNRPLSAFTVEIVGESS